MQIEWTYPSTKAENPEKPKICWIPIFAGITDEKFH